MFPLLVDMSEDESSKVLRFLELEAYSSLVTALRAQGSLDSNKLKLIKEAGNILHISEERFKSELKRVVLDERLNTIAYYVSGSTTTWEDWIQEGRSVIPPLPRAIPQTAYSAIADQVAEDASRDNELLPLPAFTERKRGSSFPQSSAATLENNKNVQFRVPETIKTEECKKRKISYGLDNSSSGQHMMSAPKMSRIQQIYRQRTKAKLKEQQQLKNRQEQEQKSNYQRSHNFLHKYPPYKQQKLPLSPQPSACASPKINILQNISIQSPKTEELVDHTKTEVNCSVSQKSLEQNDIGSQPGCCNENEAPKNINNLKSVQNYKCLSSPTSTVNDIGKTVKVCPIRKPAAKAPTGQKLIIVSNPQTITTSSILQRTLTIPFVKNISMKNFEKFKIVSTSATPLNLTPASNTFPNMSNSGSATTKHKILSLRTSTVGKKVISLSHLQALSAKGSIKMLPLGTRIITTKTPIINSSTAPIYIMNNMGNTQTVTKSSLNTPLMVPSKTQALKSNNETIIKNSDTHEITENEQNIGNTGGSFEVHDSNKSVPSTEMFKSELETLSDDIESQITQLTEIPQQAEDRRSDIEVHRNSSIYALEEKGAIREENYEGQNEKIAEIEYVEDNFIEEQGVRESEINEVVQDEDEIALEDAEVEQNGDEIQEAELIHEKCNSIKDDLSLEESVDNYVIIDKPSHQSEVLTRYEDTSSSVEVISFNNQLTNDHESDVMFEEHETKTEQDFSKTEISLCRDFGGYKKD